MSTSKSSEFHVKLDGIKLPADAESRIQSGIQSLVLQELAGFTPNPDDSGTPHRKIPHLGGGGVIIPTKWLGIWIDIFDEKEWLNVKNNLKIPEAPVFNLPANTRG